MKLKRYILLLFVFGILNIAFGQGQAGVWYFGENAGLNFNVDPSVPLTDGSLDTEEGCSTVCNSQGDLLFYTDGITVYNKNHAVMANGNDLDGNVSATQSSIIVQQPGSTVLYYIFTVDAHQNALRNGLRYSIVDMSMNGGLGAVTTKNTIVNGNEVCEKITAVKHANGTDFWILTHLWNSDEFYAYLLSSAGVSAAVVSSAGVVHNSDRRSAIGYMKTSPAGNKLAVAIYTLDLVEIFDFNTSTGTVSNPIQLNNYTTPYGVEFSPSGNILYVSLYSPGEMYQFDISSDNQATINSSAQLIGNGSWFYGALQLAPDDKIYMAKTNTTGTTGSLNLDVINNPDVIGVGCNYVADSKNLAGRRCWLGLPNFVTSIFSLEFAYQYDCEGDNTEFTITSDLTNIASASWDFADGTTLVSNVSPFTVTHVFPAAGTYDVNLEVSLISGGIDDVTQTVTIRTLPTANDQNEVVSEDTQGSGVASGINLTALETAINGSAGIIYTWYSDSGLTTVVPDPTNISVTDGQQFWVEVNDGVCTNVAVITYTVNSQPEVFDQNPEVCEDTYNSGIASNIDLSLLESAITNNNPYTLNWFQDIALSQSVTTPNNVTVTNGEEFYAEVSSGTGTSIATITYTVLTLPDANNQNETVWEDTEGSGVASGIDLTALENAINSNAGISYIWYSDAGLTTAVADPTNVSLTNGTQFWIEVNDGFCTNIALVTYTVSSLPQAIDQNLVVCEDNYNAGFASNIDLSSLESAITNNNAGSLVNWFHDIALSQPVSNYTNRTVTNGEEFYAQVTTGTATSVATVTYTVETLPEGNDISVQLWEDTFGSGTASGVDLTSYDTQVAGANAVVWYEDPAFTSLVTNSNSLVVNDQDIFYAYIDNGACINRGSVQFIVRSSPIANDLDIDVCEDVSGGGTASGIDLTALDASVNGGTTSSVSWYNDAALVNAVGNPNNVTVTDGQQFHALVESNGESNTAIISYTVLPLPLANDQILTEFEDVAGSMLAQAIDLTSYNNAITGGHSVTVEWYLDAALSNLVPTPASHDVSDGDVFYVFVSNGSCSDIANVQFEVVNTPVARDVFPEVCENAAGSASALIDLTLLENQINEGNGDSFSWFLDWPTEPNGMPVNAIPDPSNVNVTDGIRLFAAVSDAVNTNVAVVTYTVLSLPDAQDIVQDVWEDTFGTGLTTGVNLSNYNSLITNTVGANIVWFNDAAFTSLVVTPSNVSVVDNDVFYAQVQDPNCENGGSITFNVRPLPEANDLQMQICEEVQGSGNVSSYDLSQLESAVNNDPGTIKEWFFDSALSLPIPTPVNTSVSDGDVFFVRVSFGGESNVGRINFTVNALPLAQNFSVVLCEDVFNTKQVSGENLSAYESNISSSPGANLIWYSDASFNTVVINVQNIQVNDGDIYYARIWDGSCENFAELDYTITSLPEANDVSENLCEDSFASSTSQEVNLNNYLSQITSDPAAIIQWFKDDRLSIPVTFPASVTVSNQSSYYALVTNNFSCENSGRLNFYVNPLPVANDLLIELCEDEIGSGFVEAYDLTGLDRDVSGTGSIISWYEDIDLQNGVFNPLSYTITNNLNLHAEVSDGSCLNSSNINFVVHEKPIFDLGKDTTIFYSESKVLSPSIDLKFLPGTYLWQDGATSSTYIATQEGKYTLEYTDLNGCVGRDSIMIFVDRYRIFVPNAFTPNGDGLNDTFGPLITGDIAGEDIEMYIYNRWGEQIYEFTDLGVGWDGTYKGKLVSTGVYVWTLIINGKSKQDGTVSLIR